MNYTETITTIAKEVGEILMGYRGGFEEKLKGEKYDIGTIVTDADIASEKYLADKLKQLFPNQGIFGEEGSRVDINNDYVWYIDPLDGTSNYTRNLPFWGISIGLAYKGEPMVGVLYFPELDLLLSAEKGKGAFANGKSIRVSNRPLEKALYFSGGTWKGELQMHQGVLDAAGLVEILSASAYEFAQIAMGNAEIYLLASNPIDVLAGVCILREAGGVVTTPEGDLWTLESKNILATTPAIHKDLLKIFEKDPYLL